MTTHETTFWYQGSEYLVEFSHEPADPSVGWPDIYEGLHATPTENASETVREAFKSMSKERWWKKWEVLVLVAFDRTFDFDELARKAKEEREANKLWTS